LNEIPGRPRTTPGDALQPFRDTSQVAARAVDDPFNAFLAVVEEPGEGIRLGVKDLFDTRGLTTTYGSAIFRDHQPDRTAEAVRRLEVGGYANVGKTNLHEFAYGVTSENPHFGDVLNPLDSDRVAGGSSGGSAAAVAAGLCEVALGTDSGGSIRIPAACCGITGFKPTHGLVPAEGVFPLAPSFDHVGPLARTVGECVAALEVLAAPGFQPAQLSLDEISVGIAWLDDAETQVREQVEAAVELIPGRRHVQLPKARDSYPVFMREVADVHRNLFAEKADLYGEDVRSKVALCLAVTDAELEQGRAARGRVAEEFEEALEGLDLVVSPTLPTLPPPRGRKGPGDLDVRERLIEFTYPFNALGWPALALPCRPEAGFPASLQIAGRHGGDAFVLAAGAAIEEALRPRPRG
jgi:aspartyl-tRNA(Asn)/glutamyl-tRNA(Gln) amidotransferase subunit A